MSQHTAETTHQRIDRLNKECKDLMRKIKEHKDPRSDNFRELKDTYAGKKKELRYLKSTI